MNSYIIVSYYTINTPYEQIVEKLISSLENFNLEYDIRAIENLGNWWMNTQYKATYMLQMLQEHDKNIVWIDADAVVQQYPEIFDVLKCDIAVHYRQPKGRKYPDIFQGELLSGTLYFANNIKVLSLTRRWIDKIAESNNYLYDQRALQEVIKETDDLNIFQLPAAYCQIFDSMKHHGNPVIEHFQASRKYRKLRK